jgi:hypothetical protein
VVYPVPEPAAEAPEAPEALEAFAQVSGTPEVPETVVAPGVPAVTYTPVGPDPEDWSSGDSADRDRWLEQERPPHW